MDNNERILVEGNHSVPFPARHMSWCSSRNERYLGELQVLLKGHHCAAFAWRMQLCLAHMPTLMKSAMLKRGDLGIPLRRLHKAAQCKQWKQRGRFDAFMANFPYQPCALAFRGCNFSWSVSALQQLVKMCYFLITGLFKWSSISKTNLFPSTKRTPLSFSLHGPI